MSNVTIDAGNLQGILRLLKPREWARDSQGSFTLSTHSVRLRSAGGDFQFDATSDGPLHAVTAFLPEVAVVELADLLPKSGPLRMCVSGDRFRIGNLTLQAHIMAGPAPQLQAVDAAQFDIARLRYRHDREFIDRADMAMSIEAVDGRRSQAIAEAAENLAWLGIDSRRLGRWVEDYLAATASCPDRVLNMLVSTSTLIGWRRLRDRRLQAAIRAGPPAPQARFAVGCPASPRTTARTAHRQTGR